MSGLFSRRSSAGQALLDCDVHCLDGSVFHVPLSKRATGQELLLQAFRHLKIQDASSLGLVFAGESGQQEWVNPSRPLRKQIAGSSPHQFFLQVRVYPVNPQRLRDQQARYQVFLQVKKDILEGRLRCPQTHLVDALALMAQAELGDFLEEFPEDYLEQIGLLGPQTRRFRDQIVSTHKELRGMGFDECEQQLLELAEAQTQYGVTLYPVMDNDKRHINLGLGPSGVHVVMGTVHVAVYDWGSVLKVLSKYQSLHVKIRTPHTMAIHTMKFTCPSSNICKQLGLLCLEMQGVYKEVTPYTSTFRRMWSGRGGNVLVSPLGKLRQAHDTLKKRRSSDVSGTRMNLSRKLSFQGSGGQLGALPSHKKLTMKRSQSETFLAKLSELEPPQPVVTPQLRRYQETGEPVAASSPYATPTKQSLVSSEDIVMVLGPQARENSSSKAVSDSSLNNILDSSGMPVRNILRRPTIQADEAVGQMERVHTLSPFIRGRSPQLAPRVDPQPTRVGRMEEMTSDTPILQLRMSSGTPTSLTKLEGSVSNGSCNPSPVPALLSTSYSPSLTGSQSSPVPSPEGSTILRNKPGRTRNSGSRRRSSLFLEAEGGKSQESPFLDAHIASMIFETSQQEEYSCEL